MALDAPERISRFDFLPASIIRVLDGVIRFLIPADLRVFIKVLFRGPHAVGAACPSSRRLADYMAAQAVWDDSGFVVELGGGTGVVTEALLARGLPKEKLVVIERSPLLAGLLRTRFPGVTIVEGDAIHLRRLLADHIAPVRTVVSSLPLKSLPRATVNGIGRELDALMPRGATFVQFTYHLRCADVNWTPRLTRVRSKTIWRNLPPARVNVFAWGGSVERDD